MSNIVSYLRYFFNVIFGTETLIMTPYTWISTLSSIGQSALDSGHPVDSFFVSVISDIPLVFSSLVWVWFALFSFNLLIRYPFKWFKSLVNRK